jgi:hypothetical protein
LEKDESTQLLEMEKVVGCAVYVSGFLDGVSFGTAFAEDKAGRKLPSPFCFPDAIDTGQIMRIVLKYIREHPEEAHERTAVLLVRALRQAYPCPK